MLGADLTSNWTLALMLRSVAATVTSLVPERVLAGHLVAVVERAGGVGHCPALVTHRHIDAFKGAVAQERRAPQGDGISPGHGFQRFQQYTLGTPITTSAAAALGAR